MQHISSASERAPMMCQGWETIPVKLIHKGCQCEMSYIRPPNVLVLRRRLYSSVSLFCSRLMEIEVRRLVDTDVMLSGYKAKRVPSEGESEIRTKGDPGAKGVTARYSQAIPAIFNFLSCSERISYSILVYNSRSCSIVHTCSTVRLTTYRVTWTLCS